MELSKQNELLIQKLDEANAQIRILQKQNEELVARYSNEYNELVIEYQTLNRVLEMNEKRVKELCVLQTMSS
jgi:hypothetical protein